MTPDSPKLPDADAAILDRAVAEFREGVANDLQKVGGSSERLKVLSKLSEELGSVRNRLSGALRVSLGRIAFVMGLLVVGGALHAGLDYARQDNKPGQHSGDSRQLNAPEGHSVPQPKDAATNVPAEVSTPPTPADKSAQQARTEEQEDSTSAAASAAALEKADFIKSRVAALSVIFQMLGSSKDERGYPLSEERRAELEATAVEFERLLIEKGAAQSDIERAKLGNLEPTAKDSGAGADVPDSGPKLVGKEARFVEVYKDMFRGYDSKGNILSDPATAILTQEYEKLEKELLAEGKSYEELGKLNALSRSQAKAEEASILE